MEETKEQKPRKDHTMWFIILIGILVIMLVCTFVYAWKLKNTTENTDRINAERVENNNFNKKNEDLTNYQGVWEIGYEGIIDGTDYLEIKSIEDNEIIFDWIIYKTDIFVNVKATIENGNTAKFTSKNDLENNEVSGILTLKDNKVQVEITEDSNNSTLSKGKVYIYSKKKSESKSNNGITNNEEKKISKEDEKKSILDSFKGIDENTLGVYKMHYTEKNKDKDKSYSLYYFYSGKHAKKLMIGDTEKELKEISCKGVIKDAKVITKYNEKTETYETTLYILFEDGTMGKISTEDIKKKNYKVTSMKKQKDIESLLETFNQFGNEIGAGGYSAIYAIAEDGTAKLIDEGTAQ